MSFLHNAAALTAAVAVAFSGAAYKSLPDISADSCILMEAETGTVLYEKNADMRRPSASTVKIMTALVVIKHCGCDERVNVPESCVGIEGSSAYLTAGEELRVVDLLAGMMLSSGNDAAAALACHTAGNVERFCGLMNETAREIGADKTFFADANGLNDADQRTTARDLAKITREALKSELFRQIVSMKSYTCSGHSFVNHNKLLSQCKGAKGVKTGYTKRSGRALVSLIERNGMELICVTLDDPNDWADHAALADWAEDHFEKCVVARAGEPIASVEVVSGTLRSIELQPRESIVAIVPRGFSADTTINAPKFLYAPFHSDQPVGKIESEIGSTDLVTSDSAQIDETQRLKGIDRLRFFLNRGLKSLERFI